VFYVESEAEYDGWTMNLSRAIGGG
jgi:hypothetical protein